MKLMSNLRTAGATIDTDHICEKILGGLPLPYENCVLWLLREKHSVEELREIILCEERRIS